MAKKIKIELSQQSISDAIKQLEDYSKDLERKNEIFVEKLMKLGVDNVRLVMQDVDMGEDKWDYNTEIISTSTGKVTGAKLLLSGRRILYVEFGQGVIYSNPQHPKAGEMGYGVGSNSPKGWAWNVTKFGGGWYYIDPDTGESVHTKGNPAYMPMYKASLEIIQNIRKIANEVFGG